MTETKRYRSPSIAVDVCLSDFDDGQIFAEAKHRGMEGEDESPNVGDATVCIDPRDLAPIYRLRLCGQKREADAESIELVQKLITGMGAG